MQSRFHGIWQSNRQDWETPQWLFDELDREFHFTLDAAATKENTKCASFLEDGLTQDWEGVVWCNPPYGKGVTPKWTEKAYKENLRGGATIVMLLPARTDTKWFHDHCYGKAEIRFIKGRLKFEGATQPAPFPSMVVIWGKRLIDEDRPD